MASLQFVSHTEKKFRDLTSMEPTVYSYDTYQVIVPAASTSMGYQYFTGMEFHIRNDTKQLFTGYPIPQMGGWKVVTTYDDMEHMLKVQSKIDQMTETIYGPALHRTPFDTTTIKNIIALWDNVSKA